MASMKVDHKVEATVDGSLCAFGQLVYEPLGAHHGLLHGLVHNVEERILAFAAHVGVLGLLAPLGREHLDQLQTHMTGRAAPCASLRPSIWSSLAPKQR